MFTKFATSVLITALALTGAIAHAKVYDASDQYGVSEEMLLRSIDQTPSLFGCDINQVSNQADSLSDSSVSINVNSIDRYSATDSCAIPNPMPNPELFRHVAQR